MHRLPPSPLSVRKARTRTLIQLGGLVEKAGLVDTLALTIGADLQKDGEMEKPVAILLGALVFLERELHAGAHPLEMLYELGKKHLGSQGQKQARPEGAPGP